jgi:hypothetical protein
MFAVAMMSVKAPLPMMSQPEVSHMKCAAVEITLVETALPTTAPIPFTPWSKINMYTSIATISTNTTTPT